jgi:predicted GIY-YIG superfamily endonuclease
MASPQTIQIFLPSGDPQGIRIAEITTRIVRVVEIPRSLLAEFLNRPEAGQVGIYFLVGPQEEGNSSMAVYIGQSGSIGKRLAQHNQEQEQGKNFWSRALVIVSLTNNLTQTHALFLEWRSIKEAREADRYVLKNDNNGGCPHTTPPLEADCREIHATARVLMATLGYPVFEALVKSREHGTADVFSCRSSEADGRGLYTPDGFVLLKGSTGRRNSVRSLVGTSAARFRESLIASGDFRVEGNRVVATKDILFNSPSQAALAIVGASINGWDVWKNAAGQTLHEAKRVEPGDAL